MHQPYSEYAVDVRNDQNGKTFNGPLTESTRQLSRIGVKQQSGQTMHQPQYGARLTEGVFVTSRKRTYSEYVFDIRNDQNGKTFNGRPGRRGPLTESTRQSIANVKSKGGACWRCKMLKKPCDGDSPCAQCANTDGKLWKLRCQRGNLQDELQGTFPSLPGFGTSEWFLPGPNGINLRVRIKYDDPKFEIRDHDLSSYLATTQPHSRNSLLGFLKQFHDINSHWRDYYKPATEGLITLCAQIQEDILPRTSRMPANLSEEILLIALSLRALAFAHRLSLVAFHIPCTADMETFFPQPEMVREEHPSIEIGRCGPATERVSASLAADGGAQLSSMIENIVRIMQRLHFRRRPRDWPSLLCVLCLLRLILDEFYSYNEPGMCASAYAALGDVWYTLFELHEVCTKGNHAFTHDGRLQEYISLVENDSLAINHWKSLNDMWVADSMYFTDDLEEDIDSFLFR